MNKKRPKVTIVDYGIGNILSVTRGFEKCGFKVILTRLLRKILRMQID